MKLKQLIVGQMGVCCYILNCETTQEGVIIDPGGDEDRLLKYCQEQGIKIVKIINTHGHPDHVCANGPLKEATGAAIVMHEDDKEFFERKDVEQYFSVLGLMPSPPVDETVKDGDDIAFGQEKLRVIHTPGHTPGGICLYSKPNLFTGDTLFAGGVGRTDFPGGDTKTLINSIEQRLMTLPGETLVWPGHGYGGESSTLQTEKVSNPFLTGAF